MALWGKTDTLASAPKFIARTAKFTLDKVDSSADTINLTNANTNFATGDGVVYAGASGIGLTQGSTYYVIRQSDNTIKLADTEAHAKAGTNATDLTTGASGAYGYLQRNTEGNEATGASGATGTPHQIPTAGDHTYNGRDLYFIDADEAQQAENRSRGLKVPGWTNYRSYTDANGNVRNKSEVLIAMGAYHGATGSGTYQAETGDSADDAVLVDGTITISTQPASISKVAPATATFTVAATLAGAGTLAYQWQVQQSTESGATWTNVGTNSNSYTTGVTAVAPGAGATNGDKYRVIVSSTGSTSVTSSTAVLTVTAS